MNTCIYSPAARRDLLELYEQLGALLSALKRLAKGSLQIAKWESELIGSDRMHGSSRSRTM